MVHRCHDEAMSDSDDVREPATPPASTAAKPSRGVDLDRWVRRGVWVLVVLVAVVVVYLLSAAFFPRWWAQRIGDQAQGGLTAGTLWGLFYGFVFSVVPLLVLFQVRRKFLSWKGRAAVAVLALVLAAPNWLTLSIVVGSSKAAHAGERILDVEAPGFRTGTLLGVLGGAVVACCISGAVILLRRRKLEVRRLKADLKARDARDRDADSNPAPPSDPQP